MDPEVMEWWLEFDEKKPDETVIDTFESQIKLSIWFIIIGTPLIMLISFIYAIIH